MQRPEQQSRSSHSDIEVPSWPYERPDPTPALAAAENAPADVLTFGSSSSGGGDNEPLSPLSSLGSGSVGYGAAGRIEEAISLLAQPTTRQQGLDLLTVEQLHAEDAVSCEAWPQLCATLPACLADTDEAVADGAARLACVLVAQLLDCPEPLAAVLLALLAYLAQPGHCQQQQQQQQEEERQQNQAVAAEASRNVTHSAQKAGASQGVLHSCLRALHRLGRSWHYLAPHHQIELAGALCRLLCHGLLSGHSGDERMLGHMTGIEALLQLEPQMLWWHRLAAVSSAAGPLASQAHSTGLVSALATSLPSVQHTQQSDVQEGMASLTLAAAPAQGAAASTHVDAMHSPSAPVPCSRQWLLAVHLCAYLLGIWTLHTSGLPDPSPSQDQPQPAEVLQVLVQAAALSGTIDEGCAAGEFRRHAAEAARLALMLAHDRNAELVCKAWVSVGGAADGTQVLLQHNSSAAAPGQALPEGRTMVQLVQLLNV